MRISPADGSYSTFCDMLTGYRLASVVMQAIRSGIIEGVGQAGRSAADLFALADIKAAEGSRFLATLVQVGILEQYAETYYLSQFSRKYLLGESGLNQLKVLEFEQLLVEKWQGLGAVLQEGQGSAGEDLPPEAYRRRLKLFQQAMHQTACVRAQELWTLLPVPAAGTIIDVGAGDGTYLKAFLDNYPDWSGVASDLADVLEMAAFTGNSQVSVQPCNLLDPAELRDFTGRHADSASIVLLSNVIHCYGSREIEAMLGQLGEIVQADGLLVIHDFFTDGNSFGALYDAHMMVNTYNGRAYSFGETRRMMADAGFSHTEILELPSYSHAMVGSRHHRSDIRPDTVGSLRRKALSLGFFEVRDIDPAGIPVEPWVKAKCSYGCMYYGRKWSCPPHSMGAAEFRELLGCYSKAVIVAGQPPLGAFHKNLLELEKTAFLHGCKKALAFTGGPCTWCESCDQERCRYPEKRRPSLESCGCDVFALAEASGIPISPIRKSDDFVQYIGLLLVE